MALGAVYNPRPVFYLRGYSPIIGNEVDIYKLDKGLGQVKTRRWLVPGIAPTKSERIDFENSLVYISTLVDGMPIYPEVAISFDRYFANLRRNSFRKSLFTQVKNTSRQSQVTTSGLIKEFSIELPSIAMPKAVQKILGSSAGRLNLDGTQKLTLQAGSTKRKRVAVYDTDNKSRFDLKMEQETNLRLSGTIGEKIAVNLKYNSKQDEQLFDPNNVSIKYTGDEDEVISSIEAGNITLSLSGSRYISYSTSSQGLFGVTSKLKYGNLDLTVIASKEEGQKNTQTYTGTSQADSTIFFSRDYASRTMYYLTDPYDLFSVYTQADAGPNVPTGWINNAIKTDPYGAWIIAAPGLLPADGTVRLFLDDANASNNVASAVGDTIFYSPTDYYVPYYDELIEGTDFVTDYNAGIIQINRAIDRRYTLAVRYTRRDGLSVPLPSAEEDSNPGILYTSVIRRRNQEYDPDDPNNVWHYQMRNVYNMNKTNIKREGFNLEIYTQNVDQTRNYLVPDSLAVPGVITYNDYLRMDSNQDGLINGDDNTVNLSTGLVYLPFIEPFDPLGDGVIYTEENESVSYLDIRFFISVKGKIGRDAVDLAQGNILKGSVRVKVNSVEQKENLDYIVDYDFGRITFLTPAGKDPDAKIEIDYEYRGLFDISRKSLAGVRASWNFLENANLGGTFIYRSENVADKRPTIGNENIEMIMANVDGNIVVKPKFITSALDALPFISTTAESRLTLSGEIAFTMPNIYGDPDGKKNVAYLDDMESIMDSYPMGVTISSWVMASKPWATSLAKGRSIWYNPKNIRREQIEDPATLTDREKKENVTVLALKVFPGNLGMPGSNVISWGGVMKYLGNQLDFSQKKYIELLVKVDTRPGEPIPHPVMRIDLGDINEDFYTEYGGLNVLNNEDVNLDGVLTLEEDTGLDGIFNDQPGADPNDLANDNMDQYGDYPRINGTEGNRVLDTEDLDGNGVLNQLDRYFTYSFSLTDSLYLDNINHDGWRLYRIPITDPSAYQIVNNSSTTVQPNLKKISYARITLETDETAKVLISDISVIGNKWQDFYVRDLQNQILPPTDINLYNTQYLSGIVNNQKNVAHYTPPNGTVYIEERRESNESALTLNVQNLQPSHQVLLRQRFFDSYSLLSYNKLRFWIYPEAAETSHTNPDSIFVIFRVGADSLNYYEIRERVPVLPYQTKMSEDNWIDFTYSLQDITAMKEAHWDQTAWEEAIDDDTVYGFKGTPTLSNVRDIYFGILNPLNSTDPQPFNGVVYYNELRVTEPYEDIGVAKRVSLNAVLADFSTFDIDYEEKSENFNPVIQRGRSNSFTRSTTLNMSNKYFLGKLLPNTWGIDVPVTLTRNYTLGIPRYRANSDLLRENIPDDSTKTRERSETLIQAADFAFSQRTAPKNKILLYTINRLSLSGRLEKSFRHTPTAVDTTMTIRGTLNYNIGFPSDKVSFKLFKNYRIGFFPTTWNNSVTYNNTDPKAWNWERRLIEGDYVSAWYQRPQTLPSKLMTTDTTVNWGLTSHLSATARFNTKRDLLQDQDLMGLNIGKMIEYVQDLGLNYSPNVLRSLMNLTASGSARYSDTQRRYYENAPEGQIETFQSDGGTTRNFRVNITLMNSNLLGSWAQNMDRKHKAKAPKKDDKKEETPPSGETEPDPDKKAAEEEARKLEQERLDYEQKLKEEEYRKMQEAGELPPDFKYPDGPGTGMEGFPEFGDGSGKGEFPGGGSATYQGSDPGKPFTPSKGAYFPAFLVGLLSKVKNVTASYQNNYTMNFSRKDIRPPFLFWLGVPNTVEEGFLDATGDDNTFTLSSGVMFSRRLDSVLNYSYTINKRYASASNQNTAITFPDLTLSLMEVEQWLGLSKIMSGTRLNTGFQHTIRASGDIDWDKPKQESTTISMNPLLGFSGTLFKSLSTNLSFSMSRSTNVTDMDTYDILKTTDTKSLNGNLSYSFRSGRGFTIPFTKKKIHIKNELTASLSFVYERNLDKTKGRESTQIDRDNSRIAFTPGATYQFNQDIRGGLTGTYEVTSDRKLDDGVRIFNLGIWIEINL
jgi:hypothetical protein